VSATTALPLSMFSTWLAYGERGLSSEAIMLRLTGNGPGRSGRYDHPYDPADLRRCFLFLDQHPLAALVFPDAMSGASPEWARLVAVWDELRATLTEEAPDWSDRQAQGSAPRTYALMKRTLANGVKCEPCDGSGRGEACEKCKGSGRRSGGRCRARGCFRGHRLCVECHGDGYTRGDR